MAETNLDIILKSLNPALNDGDFVFCTGNNFCPKHINQAIMLFKETEGTTLIFQKETADLFNFQYSFVASWITLRVHSSLNALGLTSSFSSALAAEGISCNVVAAFYHDHIFVATKDAKRAMMVLKKLSV